MKQCKVSIYDCAARVSKCRAFVDLTTTTNVHTLKQVISYFHQCGDENGLDFSALAQVPSTVTRKYIHTYSSIMATRDFYVLWHQSEWECNTELWVGSISWRDLYILTATQIREHLTDIFFAIGMNKETSGPTFLCFHSKFFNVSVWTFSIFTLMSCLVVVVRELHSAEGARLI